MGGVLPMGLRVVGIRGVLMKVWHFIIAVFLIGPAVANAGVITGNYLLDDYTFTSNPDGLPSGTNNEWRYDSAGARVQWKTTQANTGGINGNFNGGTVNLLSHTAVTGDPDYNINTTKLTAITPAWATASFAYAGTATYDPDHVIEGYYVITIDTTGDTYVGTSTTNKIHDGPTRLPSGNNTMLQNNLRDGWNVLTWDVNPFAAGGIVYADIVNISVDFYATTITDNIGSGTHDEYFSMKEAPIEYTAETVYTPPVIPLVGVYFDDNGSTAGFGLDSGGSITFEPTASQFTTNLAGDTSPEPLGTNTAVIFNLEAPGGSDRVPVTLVPGSATTLSRITTIRTSGNELLELNAASGAASITLVGSAIVDTSANIEFADDLLLSGDFVKTGSSALTFASGSTYTGTATAAYGAINLIGNANLADAFFAISNGTVSIDNSISSNITVGGFITGGQVELTSDTPVTVSISGGLAVDNGTAEQLRFVGDQDIEFDASSVSTFEIGKNGAVRTADKLKTAGSIICDGTLNVELMAGSDPLTAGDAFDLLDGNINGAIAGAFDTVSLPALAPGLEWITNTLYTQGFIWVREINAPPAVAKPNVIILFADDLGYADCGFQPLGSTDIITPNIDTIAENGVIFTAGYANGPVCAPSRGGLMTGQYQNRFALHDTPAAWHMEDPENPGEVLHDGILPGMTCFGHRMQDLGYATCMIGKWHGGESREHYPPHRGFDEFYGFNNGAHNYNPLDNYDPGDTLNRLLMRGMFPVDYEPDYLTDAFGREAVSFINRHAHEPFFLYVPFNAPHGPMTASDEHSQILFGKNANQLTTREKLISMVYSMDLAIGGILDAVRNNGLEEETLIIFYSDNGGTGLSGGNASANTPLRGVKGQLWDGGIREPFCMQWKGQLPEGLSYDFVVTGLDLMPTAVNMAGGSFTTNDIVDGNDIMPAVLGQTGTPPNDIVVWWFNDRWVARDNEWKLIDVGSGPELYHIIDDISETTDVYGDNPDVVNRLYGYYTNIVTEFDLVTDASRWSSNEVYHLAIKDPEFQVIYLPTNTTEWVESQYPGIDMDNDGLSNLLEYQLGLPLDSPSVLSNGLSWNLDTLPSSGSLDLTYRKRTATTGENAIPAPAYTIEQTGSLTGSWSAASSTRIDGPNPTGDPDYEESTYQVDINPAAAQEFFRLHIQD